MLGNKRDVKKPLQEKNVSALAISPLHTSVIEKANIPQLPRITLHSMTKSELKSFTLDLLKLVTGRDAVFHGRRSAKPEWWPHHVPWVKSKQDWLSEKYTTESLRQIVINCYHHMGREDLLQTMAQALYVTHSTHKSPVEAILSPTTPQKVTLSLPKDLFLPYLAEVYVCFFCEKDFASKECMRRHQVKCPLRPPSLSLSTEMPSPADLTAASLPPLILPNPPSVMLDTNLPRPKQTDLLRAVDLVAQHDKARLSSRKLSSEIDCNLLTDIEPKSPVLPKTPKSLMSQLSMDEGSSARKRLRYSLSMDKERVSIEEEDTSEEETDNESTGNKQQSTPKLNLLNIPITSLLGQRIKQSVNIDSPVAVVEDSSSFCRTPVKNNFLEKLRKKIKLYPVVYKPRRIAYLHKQSHLYKFTKAQRKEFMRKVNFGLNSSSYKLYKEMKPLRIQVQKLSRKGMLRWMSRAKLQKQLKVRFKGLLSKCSLEEQEFIYGKSEFPSGPSLLTQNIDKLLGLKRKSVENKNSLSLFNCVSEEMEEEASKQKLTLYRSLLYEMSVLKPAVVIQDIKGKDKAIAGTSTGTPKSEASKSGSPTTGTHGKKKVQKESFAAKMTATKHQGEKNDLSTPGPNGKREQKKDLGNYKTLRSILDQDEEKNTNSARSNKKDNNAGNDGLNQSVEDSVSILSISSDSESFSNCCQGCISDKHTIAAGSCCLESLNISVINSGANLSMYPSPVSTCSDEKLYAMTLVSVKQDSPLSQSTPVASSTKGNTFKTPQKNLQSKVPTQITVPSDSVKTRSGSKTRLNSGEKDVEQSGTNKTTRPSRDSCKRKLDASEIDDMPCSKRTRYTSVSPIKKSSSCVSPVKKPTSYVSQVKKSSCVSPVKKEISVSPMKKSTPSLAKKTLLDYMKTHTANSLKRSPQSPVKKEMNLSNIKVIGIDSSSARKSSGDKSASKIFPGSKKPVSKHMTTAKKYATTKHSQTSQKLSFKNFSTSVKSGSKTLPLPVKWASKNSTVSEKLASKILTNSEKSSPKKLTNLEKSPSKSSKKSSSKKLTNLEKSASKKSPVTEKSIIKTSTSEQLVSKNSKTSEKAVSNSNTSNKLTSKTVMSEKSTPKNSQFEKLGRKSFTTLEMLASKGSQRYEKLSPKIVTSGGLELRSSPVKSQPRSPVKTDLKKTISLQIRVTRNGTGHSTRSKSLSSLPN